MIERQNIQPKIIFLDWYKTLSNSLFWEQLKDKPHINHNLLPQIESVLFGKLGYLVDPWMRGQYSSEEIIKAISDESDLPFEVVFEEFVVSCQRMQFVSEKVLDLVSEARLKGIRIFVATDNMDSFNRFTVPALGLDEFFDGILNSYYLRSLKRDFGTEGESLFFGEFLQREGVRSQETMLIDDSEDKNGMIAAYGINYRRLAKNESIVDVLSEVLR